MRGKDGVNDSAQAVTGITPACAGKRQSWTSATWLQRDHPRVCGEKMCIQCSKSIPQGSPPRMRGKGVGAPHFAGDLGITPAYAGKRHGCSCAETRHRDHPRVCGEKAAHGGRGRSKEGSPPRMRGKVLALSLPASRYRITPAYAGKRTPHLFHRLVYRDHPRVCGEKQHGPDHHAAPGGITPAYAGKRLKRSHSIGHFSCILRLFHSVLHRASASGGSRAGPCAPPCLPAQNAVPV